MKFIDFNLYEVSPYNFKPNKKWLSNEYGDLFGNIIFSFCSDPNYDVFESNKKIIKDKYDPNHKFFFKLKKLLYLSHEWKKNGRWNYPIIVTNYNGNFLVHPGQDRFNTMKAHGVQSYNFCFIQPEEATIKNSNTIKNLYKGDGEVTFNEKHFTISNYKVDKSYLDVWLNNDIPITQI